MESVCILMPIKDYGVRYAFWEGARGTRKARSLIMTYVSVSTRARACVRVRMYRTSQISYDLVCAPRIYNNNNNNHWTEYT